MLARSWIYMHSRKNALAEADSVCPLPIALSLFFFLPLISTTPHPYRVTKARPIANIFKHSYSTGEPPELSLVADFHTL